MNVYEYIKSQESLYQTLKVPVVEGYEWNMFEHVKRTTLYLNSQYQNSKPGTQPFKNIILPKINLEHRAVEFALREIEFYINDKDQNYKSFLVNKYHEKWARANNISEFLDQLTETYTDYGGVLVKKTKSSVEVVPFQMLAFCDQTDMMSGPICLKHQYSPDQLKDMEAVGWGNTANGATCSIDELITLSRNGKAVSQSGDREAQTPGRYIGVYELHGVLQEDWLDGGNPDRFQRQMQVVAFYKTHDNKDVGVTLFKGKEKDSIFKAFKRDPIFGRALGRGGVEELFEPQVWVNYSEIQRKEYLDQVSKVIYQTADTAFTQRNDTANLKHGQVLIHSEGNPATLLNNSAANVTAFENATAMWDMQAKEIAAAYDSITGAGEANKIPFRSSMLFNQEAHSLHRYRKGKIGGQFIPELYRDWFIPMIAREIVKGDEFLATLSLDEMQKVSEQVVTNLFNKSVIKKLLGGEDVKPEMFMPGEQEALLEAYRLNFFKEGDKKFLEILKDEMKDLPMDVAVNITDEDKNWALRSEKLASVFTQAANLVNANPNFFNDFPELAKVFNDILESSGLSPIAYSVTRKRVVPQPVQAAPTIEPVQLPTEQLTQ